jgi:hypothetical protein
MKNCLGFRKTAKKKQKDKNRKKNTEKPKVHRVNGLKPNRQPRRQATLLPTKRREIGGAVCHRTGLFGKPYAPRVSGTDPRSARVGAVLGRPVNAAAAEFFSFLCGFFSGFFVFLFSSGFSFPFFFLFFFLS